MYMGGGVLDREVAGDVFKQKTAYEVRISDGSSDVCSSDLNFQIAKMVNSTAPMIAHGKHPPQRPRFFRDGAASAGGGPERSEEGRVEKECVSMCRSLSSLNN